jgi:serine/threonine protein phosphatase PrpC
MKPGRPRDEPSWRVIGKSVQGASHVRGRIPNQDAIRWFPSAGNQLPLALAVADGHGSAKHVRSKQGADLAVQETTAVLSEWLDGLAEDDRRLAEAKSIATEKLPAEIEKRWKKAVEHHLQENPLSAEEAATGGIAGMADNGAPSGDEDPYSLYGATLLAVAVTPQFILYLQLGDGDILVVSRVGEVGRAIERDERLIANQTTSLCQSDAKDQFRVRLQPCVEMPALVIVSTDGYSNSYQADEDFLQIGPDILRFMRDEGADALEAALEGWLDDTSRNGSGDDITVGIIANLQALADRGEEPRDRDARAPGEARPGSKTRRVCHGRHEAMLMAALCLLIAAGAGYTGYLIGKGDAGGAPPQASIGTNDRPAAGAKARGKVTERKEEARAAEADAGPRPSVENEGAAGPARSGTAQCDSPPAKAAAAERAVQPDRADEGDRAKAPLGSSDPSEPEAWPPGFGPM